MANIFNKNTINNKENYYKKKLLSLKDRLNCITGNEKEEITQEQFCLLLAAIPSYFQKVPVFDFKMNLSREGINVIKDHLNRMHKISSKKSAIDVLSKYKHNGCGRNYDDFLGIWTEKPLFDVNELSDEALEIFNSLKDFSYNFYEVIGEKGFLAWDVGESINIVRDCFICGYIPKELCDEIINDFAYSAFKKYNSFEEYALSYIAGGCYYMFKETGKNEEYAKNMFDKLCDAVNDLFFDDDANVWAQYNWFKGKEITYFKNMINIDKLIESNLGCIVSNRISIDGCEIGYMYKEETSGENPDSGWRFFAGDEDDDYTINPDNMHVFSLNTLCNYDKKIIPLLDSPINTAFFKDEAGEYAVEKFRDENIHTMLPINFKEYSKYIVVKNTSEKFVLSYMKEFGEISAGDKILYEFKYYIIDNDQDNFVIIKCPDNMDFYNFNNLAAWFYGYDENEEDNAELSSTICFSKVNESQNYYTVLKNDGRGDTKEGVFENGTRFSIYLPEAFRGEQVLINHNKLHYTTVESYLNSLGLSVEDLTSIESKEFKRAEFVMTV